jgi:hypothetical protein
LAIVFLRACRSLCSIWHCMLRAGPPPSPFSLFSSSFHRLSRIARLHPLVCVSTIRQISLQPGHEHSFRNTSMLAMNRLALPRCSSARPTRLTRPWWSTGLSFACLLHEAASHDLIPPCPHLTSVRHLLVDYMFVHYIRQSSASSQTPGRLREKRNSSIFHKLSQVRPEWHPNPKNRYLNDSTTTAMIYIT